MFTSIRRYKIGAGTAADVASKVEEGFVSQLKEIDGFVGYYVLDAGDSVVVSISVFEDRSGTEESNKRAAGWVPDALAEFEPTTPEITEGEVLLSAG